MSMQDIFAFKIAATWGTAVLNGAGDGFVADQITGGLKRARRPDKAAGQSGPYRNDPGVKTVDRTTAGDLRANGLLPQIAALFGTAGVPTDLTGAYQHDLIWADDIDGLFGTLVGYDGVGVQESPSAKVVSLDLVSKAGSEDAVKFTLGYMCDDVAMNDAGEGTNNPTTIASVTVTDRGNRFFHEQLVARMNAQGGAALAGGDAIYPSEVRMSFKRPMDRIYTNAGYTIMEPKQSGMAEFSLALAFPEWTAAIKALVDDLLAGNQRKADFTWTGDIITGALSYYCKAQYPALEPLDYDELRQNMDQRITPVTINFAPLFVSSAPTGMTGITRPQLSFVNDLSTDPLA